jgi:hypothetical protein
MRLPIAVKDAGSAVTAASLALAAILVLTSCSRSGSLSGDVAIRSQSGDTMRGARISVFLVIPTEAFEREWADAVSAFRQEVAPAAEAQKAAEHRAEEARLAWDRALAVRGKTGPPRSAWTLTLRRDSSNAGSQGLWRNVRATETLVFQSRQRVWEIIQKHERRARALVMQHAAQRVQTDETGHYAIVKVPVGKAYLFAHLHEGRKADFVWFIPLQVQAGTQRADLTEANQRTWPFVP